MLLSSVKSEDLHERYHETPVFKAVLLCSRIARALGILLEVIIKHNIGRGAKSAIGFGKGMDRFHIAQIHVYSIG
jgi:hypothetical protein